MRKDILTAIMGTMLLGVPDAVADVTDTGRRETDGVRPILSRFTFGGNGRMLIDHTVSEVRRTFTLLDSDLNVIRSFMAPRLLAVTANGGISKNIEGPLDIYVADTQTIPYGLDISEMNRIDVYEHFYDEGIFIQPINLGGGIILFGTENDRDYFYPELFRYKYPTYYVHCDFNTKEANIVTREYAYKGWGPTGVFGGGSPVSTTIHPGPVDLMTKSEDSNGSTPLALTQTLFNDDETYECVVPVYETYRTSYENKTEKFTGNLIRRTGFRIMTETGSTIATVQYPSGFYGPGDESGYELLTIGDRNYLIARVSNPAGTVEYEIAYRIYGSGKAPEMMGEPMRVMTRSASSQDPTPDLSR